MNNDYVKITFKGKKETAGKLDTLIELGHVLSVETRKDQITVLDLWENKEALTELLKQELPGEKFSVGKLKGRDWNKEWIEGFQPIKIVKGLWVTPPWHIEKLSANDRKIIINPGNAFGTGTHESTYLAMKLLTKVLTPGDKVLDLGCGSGILSIAAKIMGAASVHAVDNDPDIEHNLTENLANNHGEDITWQITDILAMDTYDCDLALINIQKHVILPLLDRFSIAKGMPNRVILAGLLYRHRKDIRNALEKAGYKTLDIRRKNEWIAVSATRRSINDA